MIRCGASDEGAWIESGLGGSDGHGRALENAF